MNRGNARGGGGGGYFHMYVYWVCAAWETPIFSPKFPIRSISFSQMTKKAAPEHHHFFCRSGNHHKKKNLFNFNPFIAVHGRLTAASPNAKHSGSAAGLAAGQSASQTRPIVSSRDPHFQARAHSKAPHFHVQALSGAPHFSLCRGTYLPIFGASTPPPPPPGRKCHVKMIWYLV